MNPGILIAASAIAMLAFGSKANAQTPTPKPGGAGYNPTSARSKAKSIAEHLASKGISQYSHDLLKRWQTEAGVAADGIYGGATRGALIFYGVENPPKPFFKPTNTITFKPPAGKPPALPAKPIGQPPATVTELKAAAPAKTTAPAATAPKYVAPGSPPKGATLPGTPPKGAATPGAKPGTYTKPPPLPTPPTPAAQPLLSNVLPPAEGGSVKASPVLEPGRGTPPAGYDPAKAKTRARAIAANLAKKGRTSYSHADLKSWQLQAGLTADGLYGGSTRGALIYFGVADPPRPFSPPVATLPYVPPDQRT